MNKILGFAFFILSFSANAQLNLQWQKFIQYSPQAAGFSDLKIDNGGNVYTCIESAAFASTIQKLNPIGQVVWSTDIPNLYPGAIYVDENSGAIYYSCIKFPSTDVYVIKLDLNGNIIYQTDIGNFPNANNRMWIYATSNNEVIVAAQNDNANILAKVDANGNVVSGIGYQDNLPDPTIRQMLKTTNDEFYLLRSELNDSMRIMKYDSNLQLLWNKTVGGYYGHISCDQSNAVVINAFDTAWFFNIARFDANGNQVFHRAIYDQMYHIESTWNNTIAIVTTNGTNEVDKMILLDSLGDTIFIKNLPNGYDCASIGGTCKTFETTSHQTILLVLQPDNYQISDDNFCEIFEIDQYGNTINQKEYSLPPTYNRMPKYYTINSSDEFVIAVNAFNQNLSGYIGIAKYCPNCTGNVSGKIYRDTNYNCLNDSVETALPNRMLVSMPGSFYSFSDDSGFYSINSTPGNDTLTIGLNYLWSACDTTFNYTINGANPGFSNIDFGLHPTENISDLKVSINNTKARPGFHSTLFVNYVNEGSNDFPLAVVKVLTDPIFIFQSASVPPDTIINDTLIWNIHNLLSLQNGTIVIDNSVSAAIPIGTIYSDYAFIDPVLTDASPSNNSDTITDMVVGSLDPNEKLIYPLSIRLDKHVTSSNEIKYQINFQNTGTDTAFNIDVVDTLDAKLDVGSLQLISSSHPYSVQILQNRILIFHFKNIYLVDSFTNEMFSHGFICFSIKPKQGQFTDTIIRNTAFIYFDFNAGVATNQTQLFLPAPPKVISNFSIQIFPNPSGSTFMIQVNSASNVNARLRLIDELGRIIIEKQIPISAGINTVPLSFPTMCTAGFYSVIVDGKNISDSQNMIYIK